MESHLAQYQSIIESGMSGVRIRVSSFVQILIILLGQYFIITCYASI